jgi:hypothetical protein
MHPIAVGMNKVIRLLFLILLWQTLAYGQVQLSNRPEQDCYGAIPICLTTYSTTTSYVGSGLIPNEINPNYSCLSTGEKNDVWYIFNTHSAGYISFTLTPVNIHDDYDWAVFNITNNSCNNIYSDSTMEISCNYDANIGCNGITGPNGHFSSCGQAEGVIPVLTGETYLINISNYSSSQSGYTIDFSESTAQIFDNTAPHAASKIVNCSDLRITVQFNEPIACSTLSFDASDFVIEDSTGQRIHPIGINFAGCDSAHPYITEAELLLSNPLANYSRYYLLVETGSDQNTISDLCGNFVLNHDTIATLSIVNTQSVSLGADVTICPGNAMPLLYSNTSSTGNFYWYHNSILLDTSSPYLQPVDTGTYVLMVSLGEYCSAFDTMQLIYLPALQFELGNDISLCREASLPVISNPMPGLDAYTWFLNNIFVSSDSIQYQPDTEGWVTLHVYQDGFCPAADSLKITYLLTQVPDFGTEKTICSGTVMQLQSNITEPGHFLWYQNGEPLANDKPFLQIQEAGKYSLTFISEANCMTTDSVNVLELSTPLTPQLNCPQFSVTENYFSWFPVMNCTTYEVSTDSGNSWFSMPGTANAILTGNRIRQIQLVAVNSICKSIVGTSPLCEPFVANQVSNVVDAKQFFIISGLETPIQLMVFDAMGKEVYASRNYENNWCGAALQQGIYFYRIKAGKATYLNGKFCLTR